MTTTITPDTSVTPTGPATDDQIGHLKGLLDPRLRRLSNPQAQLFIRAGGEFQEMFNNGVAQLLSKLVVDAVIAEGNFDNKYVHLPTEKFPMTEEPVDSVEEMHFNEHLSTRKVMSRVSEAGKKFASPFTALRYAAKHPGKQLDYSMVVVFEIDGRFWYLILGRGMDDVRRVLSVDKDSSRKWRDESRYLVVPK